MFTGPDRISGSVVNRLIDSPGLDGYIMTNHKLPLIILAVAILGLAGCNRSGEHAQDNFNAAGQAIGHGDLGNAANDTGHAFSDGAHATGQAIGTGAQQTGNAINNAVN